MSINILNLSTPMTHGERILRNKIVVNLSKIGLNQSTIGEAVGLSQKQVSSILSWEGKEEVLSIKGAGPAAKFDDIKLKELEELLKKGAPAYEFEGDYWTRIRVKYVIETYWGIIYTEQHVGKILKKIDWTRQKPQKKEAKQDAAKAEAWKAEGLAALKKKAKLEDREIYYHDESTVQTRGNVVSTWAPVGETPNLTLEDTKGYQYVCVASSISVDGKLYYETRDKGFNGEEIVNYLRRLLETTWKKILLIWDNASWHKSQEVKDFLASEEGQRLWVANVPPYSPEFNPSELIWANLKRVQIPNRYAKNVKELKSIVENGMDIIANNVNLVKSFFNTTNYYF